MKHDNQQKLLLNSQAPFAPQYSCYGSPYLKWTKRNLRMSLNLLLYSRYEAPCFCQTHSRKNCHQLETTLDSSKTYRCEINSEAVNKTAVFGKIKIVLNINYFILCPMQLEDLDCKLYFHRYPIISKENCDCGCYMRGHYCICYSDYSWLLAKKTR